MFRSPNTKLPTQIYTQTMYVQKDEYKLKPNW